MSQIRNNVNLEKTLAFTVSSFTYKDPYRPRGGPLYKMRNKVHSFFSIRNMENEFVDFKSIYLHDQIPEIYNDCSDACRRRDKVTMKRSLAEPMFNLLKSSAKNPLFKHCDSVKLCQARIYVGGDNYMAEDQWAQITMRINNSEQYAVFERRLSDKLTYFDWKLSYILSVEDFDFIHKKHDFVDAQETQMDDQDLTFEEKIMKRDVKKKNLYV